MKTAIVNSKDLFDKKKNPKLSLSARDILRNKKIPKIYPLEIIQKKERARKSSFWYDGVVAKQGDYLLIATGEIRITFPDLTDTFRDYNAVKEAYDKGYKDKDLTKLEWHNNNWFEVVYGKYNKETNIYQIEECDIGVVSFDYDEGIELLKWYVKNKHYEKRQRDT